MATTEDLARRTQLPLIGRDQQLQSAGEAMTQVAGGEGLAVVISGDVGIGKSRLAGEIGRLADERGFQVAHGAAYPADKSLAYAPLIEALGRILRELEPPQQAKLLRGLEALGLIFPDLVMTPPYSLGDPALEKTRLFESMTRLLDRLSRSDPIVLFIDDLHWADQASLELIGYLGRDLASFPLMLVITYSAGYLDETPSLGSVLDTIRRSGRLIDLSLEGLTSEEITALVTQSLGGHVTAHDARLIFDQTRGNPLFAVTLLEELVAKKRLVESEGHWTLLDRPDVVVPPVVDDILTERLDRLEPSQRRLIELLAVGGGEVPHNVLRSVAGLAETDMARLVKDLQAIGLVVSQDHTGAVSYRCSHSLIARVALAHIPPGMRSRAHATFIEVLESSGDPEWEQLAWHYRHAGDDVDQDQRLRALVAGGKRALEVYANEMAVETLEVARRLAVDLGKTAVLLTVLERLGEARGRVGDDGAARGVWEEALALTKRDGDMETAARMLRKLAHVESNLGRFEAAAAHVSAGLEVLGDDGIEERIELMNAAALNHFRRGDVAAATDSVEEIVIVAADLDSPRAELRVALLRAGALLENADYQRAGPTLSRSVEMAREAHDPVAEQMALAFRALVDLSMGNLVELERDLEANRELTDRVGIPLREYRIRLYQFAGEIYSGRWDSAEEVSLEAASLSERVEMPRNRVVTQVMPVMLDSYRGDFERAEKRLAAARDSLAREAPWGVPTSIVVDIMAAFCALERDRSEEARAIIEGLNGYYLLGLLPPWGMLVMAETLARCRDPKATAAADELASLGPDDSLPAAWALRIRGLAAQVGGDAPEAVTFYGLAAERFEALGMPFETARSRLEQTEVARDSMSVESVRASYEVFTGLDARSYADRTAHLLRSMGETIPRPTTAGASGLTTRQAEVARLVAEGLTNAEVAERLFISHRTVTTHLENIYRELGLGSRTALTRYVIERGL